VFETHGLFPFLKLSQHSDKHICLWHGMPLKKIGASLDFPCSPNCDYTISTSPLFRDLMAQAFSKPTYKVLLSGQPRCDLLFEKTDFFSATQFNKAQYRMVGVWLPTYRKSIIGDIRSDGDYSDGNISFLTLADLKKLDNYLYQLNDYLFIKIHLMDALQQFDFPLFHNIRIIKPQEFKHQLYPFISACDYLLTDYSSVFIDYELCDKPIGFVMNDIEAYNNTRGLYFSDLESILPGPIINNYQELVSFIRQPYSRESSIIFNQFHDNKAGERILAFLNIL